MCGIVGLLIKDPDLRPRLGELLVPMLIGMTERGPDAAGMAVFTETAASNGLKKLSVYCARESFDWDAFELEFQSRFETVSIERCINHAVLQTVDSPAQVCEWLAGSYHDVHVLSVGRSIELYKDIGLPAQIATRYSFESLYGTHAIGHTRMATESAVTPENSHPYAAGEDWCLVHNGSLANPNSLRRMLEKKGIRFDSDCDTEAACRYLDWRLRAGDDLKTALNRAFDDFDGFYTFLMGTRDMLALVRDPFACKPAIVAETAGYVAVASEFRSLAHLPDVQSAHVFEPKPGEIYSWSV